MRWGAARGFHVPDLAVRACNSMADLLQAWHNPGPEVQVRLGFRSNTSVCPTWSCGLARKWQTRCWRDTLVLGCTQMHSCVCKAH